MRTKPSVPLSICKAVEYCVWLWVPVFKIHISWRASKGELTRRLRSLENLTFEGRLKEAGLFSLRNQKLK